MRCPDCESWNENDAAVCRKCRYDFLTRESGSTGAGGFYDFLVFRKLISPEIIKVLYAVGAMLISVVGILAIAAPSLRPDYFQGANPSLVGVAVLIVGNVLWRMLCEGIILFFSMHEVLVSLDNRAR